jgi:2-polyprenyl-3-methyl-5-hydroxy-6-metoxy-1,4-benzoquinol methylase
MTTVTPKPEAGPESPYYRRARLEMLPFVPWSVKRVLEVGCAEGLFGEAVKRQRTAEVWGIEVLSDVAERARARLDHVLTGTIEGLIPELPPGHFNCIVFNDVLEHLVDPWDVLARIRPALAPDGVVVASIPNIRHYPTFVDLVLRKEWIYQQWGILDRTHLRFFTVRSIPRLFADSGYELIAMQGIEDGSTVLPWRFTILNRLLLRALNDCRFLVFACVARPRADWPEAESAPGPVFAP